VKKWIIEKRDVLDVVGLEERALGQERCTRQSVLTAAQSAKSPSSQQREDLFTAGTVGRSTKNIRRKNNSNSPLFLFF
jgi:hypothetical protein